MRALMCCLTLAAVSVPAVCGALSVSSGRFAAQGSISPVAGLSALQLPEPAAAPVVIAQAQPAPKLAPQKLAQDPFVGTLIADSELMEMRGGFEAQSGLRVSFGIERLVLVNGQMVATTSLNLINDSGLLQNGGLRVFSGGQAVADNLPMNLGVIQIGPNNIASINAGAIAGTLIQNTLDKQNIQNITTINATVNAASMMRANRFNETLRDAMVGAMRR